MNLGSGIKVAKAILATPQIALAKPSVIRFLCTYMRKFTLADVGGNLFIHSHLPPLNSKAYARFIREHLLAGSAGPSHAQIGITSACPQNCEYCYSKSRSGRDIDTETIKRTIRDLKSLGVFWLGLTGGEPLLNKDIAEIVESAGDDCAVKLFTTGFSLTPQRARDLKNAGLVSVSVSLDHWREAEHDRIRRYPGAFTTALTALETFRSVDGLHVGVSAVLSREMLERHQVEEFLEFLRSLGIHEAWLSEAKPAAAARVKEEPVISDEQHSELVRLQDRYNRNGGMTVNYLGHFEDREHFGCSAGHKMVYVDARGDVSPCVFIPMTFGNVLERPVRDICASMSGRFPPRDCCFINRNYAIVREASGGAFPLGTGKSEQVMGTVGGAPPGKFFQLLYR